MSQSYDWLIDQKRHAAKLRAELELIETIQGPQLPPVRRYGRAAAVTLPNGGTAVRTAAGLICID